MIINFIVITVTVILAVKLMSDIISRRMRELRFVFGTLSILMAILDAFGIATYIEWLYPEFSIIRFIVIMIILFSIYMAITVIIGKIKIKWDKKKSHKIINIQEAYTKKKRS